MKLSPIILRLRAAETRFGDLIAGAIELDTALRQTLSKEMAFVVDLGDKVQPNEHSGGAIQKVQENFAVVCAVRNDANLAKQYGLQAYDNLQDVKEELWRTLVGWDMAGDYGDSIGVAYQWAEGPVVYEGSRLLDVNRGFAWYQYEFSVPSVIQAYYVEENEKLQINGVTVDVSGLNNVTKIWTQYIFADNPDLESVTTIPVSTDITNMEQYFDTDDDPTKGAFGGGFSLGYVLYTGDK